MRYQKHYMSQNIAVASNWGGTIPAASMDGGDGLPLGDGFSAMATVMQRLMEQEVERAFLNLVQPHITLLELKIDRLEAKIDGLCAVSYSHTTSVLGGEQDDEVEEQGHDNRENNSLEPLEHQQHLIGEEWDGQQASDLGQTNMSQFNVQEWEACEAAEEQRLGELPYDGPEDGEDAAPACEEQTTSDQDEQGGKPSELFDSQSSPSNIDENFQGQGQPASSMTPSGSESSQEVDEGGLSASMERQCSGDPMQEASLTEGNASTAIQNQTNANWGKPPSRNQKRKQAKAARKAANKRHSLRKENPQGSLGCNLSRTPNANAEIAKQRAMAADDHFDGMTGSFECGDFEPASPASGPHGYVIHMHGNSSGSSGHETKDCHDEEDADTVGDEAAAHTSRFTPVNIGHTIATADDLQMGTSSEQPLPLANNIAPMTGQQRISECNGCYQHEEPSDAWILAILSSNLSHDQKVARLCFAS